MLDSWVTYVPLPSEYITSVLTHGHVTVGVSNFCINDNKRMYHLSRSVLTLLSVNDMSYNISIKVFLHTFLSIIKILAILLVMMTILSTLFENEVESLF